MWDGGGILSPSLSGPHTSHFPSPGSTCPHHPWQNCFLYVLWLLCGPVTPNGMWLWVLQETVLWALWCLDFLAQPSLKIIISQ